MAQAQQASLTTKEAKSRKLLSVLMAFVMATTLMVPHAAWADESTGGGSNATTVAMIGETPYESLQAAIDAAKSTDVVTLVANATESVTIAKDQVVTIDLGSFTLTNADGKHTIANNGALTIKGTGTVDNVSHAKAALDNGEGATAVLDGGSYTRSKENGQNSADAGGNSFYAIRNFGTMTINEGVKVTQSGHYSSMVENGYQNASTQRKLEGNVPTLTINGGEFSGGLNTIKNDDCGKLVVTGGSFTNVSQAALLNWNIAEVSEGVFDATESSHGVILNGMKTGDINKGQLTITGGTFKAAADKPAISRMGGSESIGTVSVTAGSFSADVSDFCAEGYSCTPVDGMYVVAETPAPVVAKIGETTYESLEAAAAEATAGSEIALLANCETEPITFANNVTLDLGGNTLTILLGSDESKKDGLQFVGAGDSVLKNGTVIDSRSDNNQSGNWKAIAVRAANSAKLSTSDLAVQTYKPDNGNTYNYLIYVQGAENTALSISLGSGTKLEDIENSAHTSNVTYGGVGVALFGTNKTASAVSEKVSLNIVDGVTINTTGYAIAGNGDSHGTEIVIGGGSITSTESSAIYHPQTGTLVLNGGTLEGTTGIQLCSGKGDVSTDFQFNGGTVRGMGDDDREIKTGDGLVSDGSAISLVNRNYPGGMPSMAISGGTFTSANNDAVLAYKWSTDASGKYVASDWAEAPDHISITGGTYSSNVAEYCSKDYQCVQDGDVFIVSAKLKVAEVGGVQYTSLDDAIAAAADGATVTMIENVSIDASQIEMNSEDDSPYYVNLAGKSITLDLAGKAITFDLSKCDIKKRATTQSNLTDERGLIYIAAGAGLTVKDSGEGGIIEATSPAGTTYSLMSLIQNYGSFTMNSGTIKGVERVYYLATMYGSDSQTNIEGGTLDNQWGEATDGGVCLSGNGTSTYAGYKLAITGGTIKGGEQALYLPSAGTTIISNEPVLEGTGRAIEIRAGELTINGGTFTATAARLQDATAVSGGTGSYTGAIVVVKHKDTNAAAYAGPTKITINGGTFANANGDAIAAKNEIVDETTAANNAITFSIADGFFSGGINNGNLVGPTAEGVNKLSVSGGYFTSDPSAYVAEGKAALLSDKADYQFMVVDKPATDAKPVIVEPDVKVEDEEALGGSDKAAEIVDSVSQTQVEGLGTHVNSAVEQLSQEDVDKAAEELHSALPDVSTEPVSVYVQAYLEITAKAYSEEGGAKSLALDITPKTRIVATTAEKPEDIKFEEGADKNAVVVGEPEEMKVTTETIITVPLPAGFVSSVDDAVYAKHVKADGKTYTYKAVLSGDIDNGFVATFTNPHGFSEFTVTTSDDSVAQIDGVGYPTLQAAIDAVTDGQTIKLLKNADGAIVSKAVSFTLDANSFTAGTIAAGEGYLLNVEGNVYTVKTKIPVTSVALDQTTLTLAVGATSKLVATVSPADTTDDKTVTWSTSDDKVATVAQDGTVTAVKAGKATITATAGGEAATCEVTVAATKDLSRLGGDDRYKTMALISKASFPTAGSCETVIIARGDNFPDALAAAGLAGVTGGQVLLTETGELTAETKAEITRLGAKKAYVIGDENSITTRTFNEIKSLAGNAERLGGETRLDTAVEIYKAGGEGWGDTAIVATGKKAADSLSASPIAYALKAPIFLADDSGNLPATAFDAIAKGGFKHVIVLGDKYSVSDATYTKIETAVGSAERIGGADRYITSQLTAERALKNNFTCDAVSLTAGRDGKYADALVASSLSGKSMSLLLLVDDGDAGSVCVDKVLAPNKDKVGTAYVLGDKYTVSDALLKAIEKAIA